MKILTKEEEAAHYSETLRGGALGGSVGLLLGVAGVYGAAVRYPAFRQLTLPLRAFLVTSSATFGSFEKRASAQENEHGRQLIIGIVTADHFSRAYEASRHPDNDFKDSSAKARAAELAGKSSYERFMNWGREHRYQIVGGSWVLSMVLALSLTGRNPYLSTQQKLVQARVYAQTLTIGVLVASAVFEIGDQSKGKGRWETIKVLDENDPSHKHLVDKKVHHERYEGEDQWRDMVEAEEQRLQARDEAAHRKEAADKKAGKRTVAHIQSNEPQSHDHHDKAAEPKSGTH